MTKDKVKIEFDEERARMILPILIKAYLGEEIEWVKKENLPEIRFLPDSLEIGSYEHRCFLWFSACLMRGQIGSDEAFKVTRTLFSRQPEVFYPERVAHDLFYYHIRKYLPKLNNHFGDVYAKAWIQNAKGLKFYDWDPKNAFVGVTSYRDVWGRLINKHFFGWREKIVSLLTMWYEEAEIIPLLYGPPPLDIHVLRVLISTGILKIINLGKGGIRWEKVVRIFLPIMEEFCSNERVVTHALDGALWLLSKHMCTHQLTSSKRCPFCPVNKDCHWFLPYYDVGKLFPQERKQLLLTL